MERLQRSHDTLAERIGAPDPIELTTDSARSLHAEMESEPEDNDDGWLRSEAVQVYKQLRALALQLNTGHDDDSGKCIINIKPPNKRVTFVCYVDFKSTIAQCGASTPHPSKSLLFTY